MKLTKIITTIAIEITIAITNLLTLCLCEGERNTQTQRDDQYVVHHFSGNESNIRRVCFLIVNVIGTISRTFNQAITCYLEQLSNQRNSRTVARERMNTKNKYESVTVCARH